MEFDYEMYRVMHKSFSFKGINRSTDVALAQDGECLDIVNLRMSDGSLLPMPQPEVVAELGHGYSELYWHGIAECYVAVTGNGTLHFYHKDFTPLMSGDEMLAFSGMNGVGRIEFVGNIVCCLTEDGIYYLLYENRTYRMLGLRPEIPDVGISLSSKVETVTTEETYYSMAAGEELESIWNYNEKGYIDECVSALNKAGYYVDRALFRVALRLYDGSYINVSNVIYASDETNDDGVGRDAENMLSEAVGTESPSKYRVRVRGFKPTFTFTTAALEAWRNIVVGVDVFSTASIPGRRSQQSGRTEKFEMYTAKSLDELWNDIASASLFYKVAEYDIDGNLTYSLDDVSPVSLALQQGLDTESVPSSLSEYAVRSSYVYNGRLHIAALRELFFKGYGTTAFRPLSGGSASVDAMAVQVKVRTTQGDFLIGRHYVNPRIGYNGYTQVLPAMLTYPDSRACEMCVYIKVGGTVYRKMFPLKAHNFLDIAYYLHKWYSPYSTSVTARFANGGQPASGISSEVVLQLFGNEPGTYEVVYNSSRNCWTYDGADFPPSEYSSQRIFAIHRNAVNGDKLVFTIKRDGGSDRSFKDINNIPLDNSWEIVDSLPELEHHSYEERLNVMKVSMVENPFVFPAKCTYTPSQEAITGMCGNTVALSQGQFGQFPLYVFCADGIWAMSVDASGNLAYAACNQVARDICVNPTSICGISGGVVFAGSQGLMLIAGNNVGKISAAMEGYGGREPGGVPDNIFARISSLVSLECNTGGDSFHNFLAGAFVTQLPAHNELLVCNTLNEYAFVYSFASGIWTRYKAGFTGWVKGSRTPYFIRSDGEETTVYYLPEEESGSNRVLLFTRPQLWGTKLPKRVMQLLLHTSVELPEEPSNGMPLLGCYMLAGNDGVHFKLIAGSEKNRRAQDVLFPYFPTQSYKYYMFAIIGDLGRGSAVTAMEVDMNIPWRNKLR